MASDELRVAIETLKWTKWGVIVAFLSLLALIGIGAIASSIAGILAPPSIPDYSVDISVTPNAIPLNSHYGLLIFKLTVTNNGSKDIPQFSLPQTIYLHRIEDGFEIFFNQPDGTWHPLPRGQQITYTISTRLDDGSNYKIFEDGRKHLELLIYVQSYPLLKNEALPIEIS